MSGRSSVTKSRKTTLDLLTAEAQVSLFHYKINLLIAKYKSHYERDIFYSKSHGELQE